MPDKSSISVFRAVRRKWTVSTVAADIFYAAAAGILFIFPLRYFFNLSLHLLIPLIIVMAAVLIFFDRSWRIADADIASFLDRKFPVLEESSSLLLAPADSLTPIQQLQAHKISSVIGHVENPGKINTKLYPAIIAAILAGAAALFLSLMSTDNSLVPVSPDNKISIGAPVNRMASISNIAAVITPPLYTGKSANQQHFANIVAVEGSTVKWTVSTSASADSVSLRLNDLHTFSFTPSGKDSTLWEFNLTLKRSGFYQFVVDGKTSALYQLQVARDVAPKISVASPKPDLLIKYGQAKQFVLQATITDDYGIKNAYAFATVSSGSGEAVQFRQKKLNFPTGFTAQKNTYDVRMPVQLDSLSMSPGDELYLYVMAIDNFNQETRSDVFRVMLEDTAQLFSVDGLMNGLDIKPEYFRSQRQIIIETEQLLRDQSKLTRDEFENKSNSLGIDQKLLRLRYGKFLGEEAVTYGQGDAEHHDEGEGHDEHQNESSSPQDVLSQFGHSHDNAEDATYFDAATKKQLRATLNEMWKAELQLRTFKPKDALPFELEALRLLKDLQQKSRVYVAKTNARTTPLKPETRLTGELTEIVSPVFSYVNVYIPDQSQPLQKALGTLQQLQYFGTYHSGTSTILQEADRLLSTKAVDEPSRYIAGLTALRNIIKSVNGNTVIASADIVTAQKAIQALIDIPVARPVLKHQQANALSDLYFYQLKNGEN